MNDVKFHIKLLQEFDSFQKAMLFEIQRNLTDLKPRVLNEKAFAHLLELAFGLLIVASLIANFSGSTKNQLNLNREALIELQMQDVLLTWASLNERTLENMQKDAEWMFPDNGVEINWNEKTYTQGKRIGTQMVREIEIKHYSRPTEYIKITVYSPYSGAVFDSEDSE